MSDIDWSKVHKDYAYLVQHVEEGVVYTCSQDYFNKRKDNLVVLAERPKPALTEISGKQLLDELLLWGEVNCHRDDLHGHIEKFIKVRGGEHE